MEYLVWLSVLVRDGNFDSSTCECVSLTQMSGEHKYMNVTISTNFLKWVKTDTNNWCYQLAIGVETVGGVRQPTGHCCIVGLRPTYVVVSHPGDHRQV